MGVRVGDAVAVAVGDRLTAGAEGDAARLAAATPDAGSVGVAAHPSTMSAATAPPRIAVVRITVSFTCVRLNGVADDGDRSISARARFGSGIIDVPDLVEDA